MRGRSWEQITHAAMEDSNRWFLEHQKAKAEISQMKIAASLLLVAIFNPGAPGIKETALRAVRAALGDDEFIKLSTELTGRTVISIKDHR